MTLARTVRLRGAAWADPGLRLGRAIAPVDYHVRRHRVAEAAHDKAWLAKHGGVKFLLL